MLTNSVLPDVVVVVLVMVTECDMADLEFYLRPYVNYWQLAGPFNKKFVAWKYMKKKMDRYSK